MELDTLARYKYWADDLLYECLSGLPEQELQKERPMLFGNILSLLHHVYAMDIVWQSNLGGKPHNCETRNPEVRITFEELREKQNNINNWYEVEFKELELKQCMEEVHFQYIGGGAGVMLRADILQHIVNHSSYHRGHIEGVLYQMLIEPPTTDISVFLKSENA